jgi:hypothetical protein
MSEKASTVGNSAVQRTYALNQKDAVQHRTYATFFFRAVICAFSIFSSECCRWSISSRIASRRSIASVNVSGLVPFLSNTIVGIIRSLHRRSLYAAEHSDLNNEGEHIAKMLNYVSSWHGVPTAKRKRYSLRRNCRNWIMVSRISAAHPFRMNMRKLTASASWSMIAFPLRRSCKD